MEVEIEARVNREVEELYNVDTATRMNDEQLVDREKRFKSKSEEMKTHTLWYLSEIGNSSVNHKDLHKNESPEEGNFPERDL